MGLIWVMDSADFKEVWRIGWLSWLAFAVTLYAGLSMVTMRVLQLQGGRRQADGAVATIMAIALGHCADQSKPAACAAPTHPSIPSQPTGSSILVTFVVSFVRTSGRKM
jgi:hypothetical protein